MFDVRHLRTWSSVGVTKGERAEGKAWYLLWSRSRLGRAGDEARELLPWTAGPGAQKNFDPEHPLARDSKGRGLALLLYSCLIQYSCVVSSPLALCISHPLPIPRGPSCPRARVYVCDGRGGKRSKVSPRGALAPFLAFVPDNGFKSVCQLKWVYSITQPHSDVNYTHPHPHHTPLVNGLQHLCARN